MNPLTDRQTEILEFIRESLRASGSAPSREDIAAHFGFTSRASAEDHLRALEKKGYLEIRSGSARGIRLLNAAEAALARQYELPLVGSIAAGTPVTAEANIDTWLKVDPELFRPRADFLHRVSGHSMKEADILDGDIVGIHAQEDADNGQIVAAVMPDRRSGEDTITLKRYFRRGNKIVLKPENSSPSYKPIEIDLSAVDPDSQDEVAFRIAGIYAGLIRAPR